MTIAGYLRVLRKRWRTITAVTVLCVVVAGVVTVLLPQTFEAESTSFVSISDAKTSGSSPDALYQNSQFALNQVQSYPAIVTSPAVLQPVIDDLGLSMSVSELRQHVTVTNPANTVLLRVQATSGSARQARDIANAVSDDLGSLLENLETPRSSTSSPVKVSTAVPASIPTAAASPRPALNLALGLLVGLVLGAVTAAVRERLDTSIKSFQDLAHITGANPIGSIRKDKNASGSPLLVMDRNNPTTEDFRSVRTSLRYVDVDQGTPRQIVISSAVPGEGKSLVAVNLALVMAQPPDAGLPGGGRPAKATRG